MSQNMGHKYIAKCLEMSKQVSVCCHMTKKERKQKHSQLVHFSTTAVGDQTLQFLFPQKLLHSIELRTMIGR